MPRIQPLSVLLGLAVAGLCFVTMAQATAVSTPLRVEYVPHPRDMVTIREGEPSFVVPPGKIFVLRGLGHISGGGCFFYVNGAHELTTANVPDCFTVPGGNTIDVSACANLAGGGCSPTKTRAWGYLADQ